MAEERRQSAPEVPGAFARVYCVELLYESAPTLAKTIVYEALRRRCPDAEPLDGNPRAGLLAFAYREHTVQYRDACMPAQCLIAPADKPFDPAALEPALQQSWQWRGAREAITGCRASVLVTDVLSAGLEYRARLELLQKAVAATLEAAPCRAIHWTPTQQCVNPQGFLAAMEKDGYACPLPGALNVRFYRISGYGDRPQATTEDMVADTLGLAALGLADLQCHFRGLDPNAVVRVLYNAACYLFEKGPVIQDGNTVQGPNPWDRWTCRHEKALVAPERVVLDLDPGAPHAAGRRPARG